MPDLCDNDGRAFEPARMVEPEPVRPGGDGGDWSLLGSGVEDIERGRFRTPRRQCGAHQIGSRPQDRHERRDVDCRPRRPRPDQGELRPRRAARAAHADANPKAAGARTNPARSTHPEDFDGGEHSAGFGDQRRHGRKRRRMIEAMIAGVRDPRKLAALADRRVKATPKELYDALHGRLTDHHRFLLQLHIGQWDSLDASIRAVDREVDARVTRLDSKARADKARFSDLTRLLASIPGVSQLSAVAILSEIGTDMGRFDTAGHLIAWAGLCPGQNESAGKRKRTRLRKGAPWLKTMLVQCAWAAKRANNSYYKAQFFRLQARRGPQKAICAVAASILTAIYHMLRNGTCHNDLGVDYFDRRSPELKAKRLARQIAKLGYEVTLQAKAA